MLKALAFTEANLDPIVYETGEDREVLEGVLEDCTLQNRPLYLVIEYAKHSAGPAPYYLVPKGTFEKEFVVLEPEKPQTFVEVTSEKFDEPAFA